MLVAPYRNLPWKPIVSVLYTTFALWCFNLALFFAGIVIAPLLIQPEYIFEAWKYLTINWFTSSYQLYYFWFCFVFSVILNFSE